MYVEGDISTICNIIVIIRLQYRLPFSRHFDTGRDDFVSEPVTRPQIHLALWLKIFPFLQESHWISVPDCVCLGESLVICWAILHGLGVWLDQSKEILYLYEFGINQSQNYSSAGVVSFYIYWNLWRICDDVLLVIWRRESWSARFFL